jgi:hypothetical protein
MSDADGYRNEAAKALFFDPNDTLMAPAAFKSQYSARGANSASRPGLHAGCWKRTGMRVTDPCTMIEPIGLSCLARHRYGSTLMCSKPRSQWTQSPCRKRENWDAAKPSRGYSC